MTRFEICRVLIVPLAAVLLASLPTLYGRALACYIAFVNLRTVLLVSGNLGPTRKWSVPIYRPAAELTAIYEVRVGDSQP